MIALTFSTCILSNIIFIHSASQNHSLNLQIFQHEIWFLGLKLLLVCKKVLFSRANYGHVSGMEYFEWRHEYLSSVRDDEITTPRAHTLSSVTKPFLMVLTRATKPLRLLVLCSTVGFLSFGCFRAYKKGSHPRTDYFGGLSPDKGVMIQSNQA